jgi:hypothetical protein
MYYAEVRRDRKRRGMASKAEKLYEMLWTLLALLLGIQSTFKRIFWQLISMVFKRIRTERNSIAHVNHNVSLAL